MPNHSSPHSAPNPLPPASRPDGRRNDQLRPVRFHNDVAPYALGSTLIEWGNTRVICAVTIEDSVPRWMKEQNVLGGWITAEYSMLPYSTLQRKPRDSTRGRIDGRSQEIQRLIGRSLRAALDLLKLGPRTIWIDCDVLQADGGTRTAAITGSFVALSLAIQRLIQTQKITENPLLHAVAAVSVGMVQNTPLLDLCYTEDVDAQVDMNLVMTDNQRFIELQGSGEEATFDEPQLHSMLALSHLGFTQLFALQQHAISAISPLPPKS
jgi:ribonuclease PH